MNTHNYKIMIYILIPNGVIDGNALLLINYYFNSNY